MALDCRQMASTQAVNNVNSSNSNHSLLENHISIPTHGLDNSKRRTIHPTNSYITHITSKPSLLLNKNGNQNSVPFRTGKHRIQHDWAILSTMKQTFLDQLQIPEKKIKRNVTRKTNIFETLSIEEAVKCLEQQDKPPSVDILISILQKCRKRKILSYAKRLHRYIKDSGLEDHKMLGNYIVPMFVDCGSVSDAEQVFKRLVNTNEYSWSSLIHGHVESGNFQHALILYEKMHENGVYPSTHTFVSLLKACARMKYTARGQVVHSQIIAAGCEREYLVGNILVDMYAKCGLLSDAKEILAKLTVRDVVSWTALISGYADHGLREEVSRCLNQMYKEGITPDAGLHVCTLKAFSNAGAIDKGREVHALVIKGAYESDPLICNILVDMYAKCGSLSEAWEIFYKMPSRNVISWTSLIAGHARCGESETVFELFEEMREDGVQPNDATFLILLSVCSHAGMVERGSFYFEVMRKEYNIAPGIKHYNCMLDLLSRAGQFAEALLMLEEMPLLPNVITWKTILSACKKWGNVQIAKRTFEWAMRMKVRHASIFMLMSNIYADANMWEDLKKMEEMQASIVTGESVGKSWVETGDDVREFVEGKSVLFHHEFLESNSESTHLDVNKHSGTQVADINKDCDILAHSKDPDIKFCLKNAKMGMPIRIVRTRWLHRDSHISLAILSRIIQQTIICRDGIKYHVLKDGKCSCGGL